MPLNPLPRRPKQRVPQPRLLAVVGAALPPLTVMQVMVLEGQLDAEEAQGPGCGVGEVGADARVAAGFDEAVRGEGREERSAMVAKEKHGHGSCEMLTAYSTSRSTKWQSQS